MNKQDAVVLGTLVGVPALLGSMPILGAAALFAGIAGVCSVIDPIYKRHQDRKTREYWKSVGYTPKSE